AVQRRDDATAQHLAALVRSSPDAIFATDAHGRVTAWNPGAQRLYGWTAKEAIGSPVDRLETPSRAGETADLRRRVLAGASVEDLETERLCRDGSSVPVSISLAVLRNGRGRVSGITTIARDITDRVRNEAMRG